MQIIDGSLLGSPSSDLQNLHTVTTALCAGEDARVCGLKERQRGAGGRGWELKRVRE